MWEASEILPLGLAGQRRQWFAAAFPFGWPLACLVAAHLRAFSAPQPAHPSSAQRLGPRPAMIRPSPIMASKWTEELERGAHMTDRN